MSCAAWTLLGFYVRVFNPTAKTQMELFFAVAGASLLVALLRTISEQQSEVKRLRLVPPEMSIVIEDLAFSRSSGDVSRFQYAELFILATVHLRHPACANVKYALEIIWKGHSTKGQLINDLQRWEIIDKRYSKHLGENIRDSFVKNWRE